jgi:hypothetical protein
MPTYPPTGPAPLAARQLSSLLGPVALTEAGHDIHPSALALGGTELGQAADHLKLADFSRTEPLIRLVARMLGSILRRCTVSQDGRLLRPGGFRLRRLADWSAQSTGATAPMLELLSSPCRVSCSFCYHLGNPPGVGGTRQNVTWDEIETRLRYFRDGLLLPRRNLSDVDEVFTHPRCFDLLDALFTDGPRIVVANTNGCSLTEDVVERLADYRWALVNLSLTSSNPEVRRVHLRDARPEVAIASLEHMDRHRVPYSVSIVAWPPIGLDDLERTIIFCDSHLPAFIRVYFPGATRFFRRPPDSAEAYWLEALEVIRRLRPRLSTPLTLDLQKYEEVLLERWSSEPRVLGTVRNSPARAMGLRWGDVITRVGDRKVFFRDQLKAVLDASSRGGSEAVVLEWSRDGDLMQGRLGPATEGTHPYGPFYPMGGLVVSDGISTAHLGHVARAVRKYRAKEVLFLSSRLMAPLARDLFRGWRLLPPGTRVTVVPVPNAFFGGNVFVGDLLVVDDYVQFLTFWMSRNGQPDLVLIPSSPFTDWGRDLVGTSHLEIARATGLPVELIPVSRMTF